MASRGRRRTRGEDQRANSRRLFDRNRCSAVLRGLSWSFPWLYLLPEFVMKLLGKKALVTGAARGIGRGVRSSWLGPGPTSRSTIVSTLPRPRRSLLKSRHWAGKRCWLKAMCFNGPSCESVVDRAITALGRIDIFVSNPAFQRRADFLDFDPEIFGQSHRGDVHRRISHEPVRGTAHGRARGGGKIVFISSCHVHIPYARSVAYNAGKGGLNQMAFTIAAELYPHRINVNVIEPGWIDTPGEHEAFGDELMAKAGPPSRGAALARPKTSARPPLSLHQTMPITLPVPPCALMVEFCSSTHTNKCIWVQSLTKRQLTPRQLNGWGFERQPPPGLGRAFKRTAAVLQAWRTVAGSRPPKYVPIAAKLEPANIRARYIAT